MSITDIFSEKKELLDIENSEVYILDTISCGFVTNTAKKLIKQFNKSNNQVYFLHYISPYMVNHSVSLKQYQTNYIETLLEKCINNYPANKRDKIIELLLKMIDKNPDIDMNLQTFTDNNLPPWVNKLDFTKCAQEFLSDIDLNDMHFTKIEKTSKNIDWDNLTYPVNCSYPNDIDKHIKTSEPKKRKAKKKRSPC